MPPAVGYAIGGVGSLAGGLLGSSAANSAADKQAAAADRANQLQYQMFQQQMNSQKPWQQAGVQALYGTGGLFKRKDGGSGVQYNTDDAKKKFIDQKMQSYTDDTRNALDQFGEGDQKNSFYQQREAGKAQAYKNAEAEFDKSGDKGEISADQYDIDPDLTRSFTNDDFVKDPGYDFRMQEGQKALERSAAARGGLQGGGTMKALSRYGQDYASNEYSNAYNRFNNDRSNRFNRLSSIAGLGQSANAQVGAAGQNYATGVGNNMMGAANAQGAAGIASANAWGGALSGLGSTVMGGIAANNQQNWMDKYLEKMK